MNVFFIISKKKKNSGHPVNRGLARSGCGLIRSGPKKSGFKRAEKTKALTLKFFRLNGSARGPPARLTALHITSMLIDHLERSMLKSLAMNVVENATLLFIVLLKLNALI